MRVELGSNAGVKGEQPDAKGSLVLGLEIGDGVFAQQHLAQHLRAVLALVERLAVGGVAQQVLERVQRQLGGVGVAGADDVSQPVKIHAQLALGHFLPRRQPRQRAAGLVAHVVVILDVKNAEKGLPERHLAPRKGEGMGWGGGERGGRG